MKLSKLALVLTFCAVGCGMAVCAPGCGESEPPSATTKEEYMASLPEEVRIEEEKLQKRVDAAEAKRKAKAGAKAKK